MSVTTTKQISPVEQLRGQLVKMTPEFQNALPSHIKPEKFQRVVLTVAQQNPDLLMADRRTLFASCIKCAADGLIPDGREAALVIFNTKIKQDGRDVWVKAVQYMPMIGGLQKRARNSGEIAGIVTQVVYSNDEFVQQPDDFDKPIHHRPAHLGTDRGKAIGAYAMAKLKDGTIVAEVMDIAEIEKVRAASRSKDKGPWVDWYEQMMRKSVFRRLSKWLPMDADLETIVQRDDETDEPAAPSGYVETSPTIDADEFEAASAGKVVELHAAAEPAGEDDTFPGDKP